jgi:hypothetical protein
MDNHNVADLIDQQQQIRILQHLHQVLCFLQTNVEENRSYILYRHHRDHVSDGMGLFLYEVTDQNDAKIVYNTSRGGCLIKCSLTMNNLILPSIIFPILFKQENLN